MEELQGLWDLVFYISIIGFVAFAVFPFIGWALINPRWKENYKGRRYGYCQDRGARATVYFGLFCLVVYSVYKQF